VIYLWLMGAIIFNIYFSWQLSRELPVFVRKLPELTFQQGRLITPDTPHTISIPKTPYVILLNTKAQTPPDSQEFLDKKIVAFVTADAIYLPSIFGVNKQPFSPKLDGTLTTQLSEKYIPAFRTFLQTAAFFGSFLIVGFFLLFSLLLSFMIVLTWRTFKRIPIPFSTVGKWAVFLQGPALVLWSIHLIYTIPLFTFALFILFNIYTQQIFNTLPLTGDKKHVA